MNERKFITVLKKEIKRLKAELKESNTRAAALARPANELSPIGTYADADEPGTAIGGVGGSQNAGHAVGGTGDNLGDVARIDLSRPPNASPALPSIDSVSLALDTSLPPIYDTSPASTASSLLRDNQPTNPQLGANIVPLLDTHAALGEPDSLSTGTGRGSNSNGALSSTFSTRASDGDSSIIHEYESPQAPATPAINITCKRPDSAQVAGGQA